jgi:hypothetical protein
MEQVESVKKLNEFFKLWKSKKLADVELPEEVTLAEMEKIFVTILNEMSFEDKLNGGYTKDMDEYLLKLTQRQTTRRKSKKAGRSEEEIKAELGYISELKGVIHTIADSFNLQATELPEDPDRGGIETLFLEIVMGLTEEQFIQVMKEDSICALFFGMALERKLQSIVLKNRKRRSGSSTREVKKWDGEGEPFHEKTPQGDDSMTFFIWEKAKEGKTKFDDLEKEINKLWGEAKKGPRSLQRAIDRMNRRLDAVCTIQVVKDKVKVVNN